MNYFDDDWTNGGRALLVRMSKNDRDMLEYLYKQQRPWESGVTRSGIMRALIRMAYAKANGKRKRQLGQAF
jgi:hypothetical protein